MMTIIAMTNVLMLFLLASQVRQSFERLTVIREQYSNTNKFTCISEDDGAALVWNENISKELKNSIRKLSKHRIFLQSSVLVCSFTEYPDITSANTRYIYCYFRLRRYKSTKNSFK